MFTVPNSENNILIFFTVCFFRDYFLLKCLILYKKHIIKRMLVDFGGRLNFISLVVKRNIYFHEWHSQIFHVNLQELYPSLNY